MNKNAWYALRYWLPMAGAVTLLSGSIYIAVQQDYRHTANDPQIQLAQDIGRMLGAGQDPQTFIRNSDTDIANSLAPYIVIYDESGKGVIASAQLDGKIPTPPPGVFDYTRQHGEDRITWQPRPDVRSAIVIVHFKDKQSGFILAGRSLREVEKRVGQLTAGVFAGWMTTLIITFALTFLLTFKKKTSNKTESEVTIE